MEVACAILQSSAHWILPIGLIAEKFEIDGGQIFIICLSETDVLLAIMMLR